MNNSYNYADFIGMSLTTSGESEAYGYQQELQQQSYSSQETPAERNIENMLFNHHKYHIYCE